eukprot:6332716-Prorocentrum_lima.AAC.1
MCIRDSSGSAQQRESTPNLAPTLDALVEHARRHLAGSGSTPLRRTPTQRGSHSGTSRPSGIAAGL